MKIVKVVFKVLGGLFVLFMVTVAIYGVRHDNKPNRDPVRNPGDLTGNRRFGNKLADTATGLKRLSEEYGS